MKYKNKVFKSIILSLLTISLVGCDFSLFNSGEKEETPVDTEQKHEEKPPVEICKWTHFLGIEPTYDKNGVKEFWSCSVHNDYVLVKPTDGEIVKDEELSSSFVDYLKKDDPRIIPCCKETVEKINANLEKLKFNVEFEDSIYIDEIESCYEIVPDQYKDKINSLEYLQVAKERWNEKYQKLLSFDKFNIITGDTYQNFDFSLNEGFMISNIKNVSKFSFKFNNDIQLNDFKSLNFFAETDITVYLNVFISSSLTSFTSFSLEAGERNPVDFSVLNYPNYNIASLRFEFSKEDSSKPWPNSISFSDLYAENNKTLKDIELFDAKTDIFTATSYSADFQNSHKVNEFFGDIYQISQSSNTSDGFFIKPNVSKDIYDFDSIYFYFKVDKNLNLQIKETNTSKVIKSIYVKKNVWEKISIDIKSDNFSTYSLSDFGFYQIGNHALNELGTWTFTSIFGNTARFEIVNEIVVPKREVDDQIEFNAYSTPHSYSKTTLEQIYGDAKYAGFTNAIGLLDGRENSSNFANALTNYVNNRTSANKEALRSAVKDYCDSIKESNMTIQSITADLGIGYYGLNAILYDFKAIAEGLPWTNDDYKLVTNFILDNTSYLKDKNYYGEYYFDEPNVDDDLSIQAEFIKDYLAKSSGELYINLLPLTGTDSYSLNKYNNYINNYMTKIFPKVGYLSYDFYPLRNSSIDVNHLLNLEITAEAVRNAGGGNLRTFVYSNTAEGDINGIDSVNDLNFQIFSNLVYGSNHIVYFEYSNHQDSTSLTNSLINSQNYKKSDTYYYAAEANNKVHSFEKAYLNYKWFGTTFIGANGSLNRLEHKLSSSETGMLKGYAAKNGAPFLIGCFADERDNNAYMIMNYQNTNSASSFQDEITLEFKDNSNAVLIYKDGAKLCYRLDANHQCKIKLDVGCGAFVVPVKTII